LKLRVTGSTRGAQILIQYSSVLLINLSYNNVFIIS
jgi:hypothetical protein